MADTNITLENLLELAQAATSIGDGDYIFIYKAGANGFSKIEKNVFFQGIAASTNAGIDSEAREKIEAMWAKVNELIGDLANLAFKLSPTNALGELDWDSSTPVVPSEDPTLTLKSGGVTLKPTNDFTVGQHTGSGVSKTISVQGANLTENLTIAVTGSGFSVSTNSISASDANNGTTFTITFNGTTEGQTTGTLIVSSSEVSSGTITTKGSYIQQGGGDPVDPESYQVSAGTLSHVQITETLPATVSSGGSFTGHLVADSGYSLPSSIVVSGTHGTVSYDQSNGGVFTISNITSNVAISATAVPSGQQNDYVQDGLVFHLDGQNQGSETGKWIDSVGLKEFVLNGNYELISGKGIKFLDAGDGNSAGYGEYSGDPLYATVDGAIDYNTFNKWTIEVVMTTNQNFSAQYTHGFFSQKSRIDGVGTCPISAALQYLNGNNYMIFGQSSVSSTYKSKRPINGSVFDPLSFVRISQNAERMVVNGVTSTAETEYFRQDAVTYGMRVGTSVAGSVFTANATIHEVRIYNRLLTESEMLQNQQVDSQRYGGN